MESILFVLTPFQYEKGNRECSCYQTIRFLYGDLLHVMGDPFYVENLGWYIGVYRNDDSPFYMSAHFIDDLYEKGVLYTKMDLTLAINFHQYKLDQSLDDKNKQHFISHKTKLDQFTALHPEYTIVEKR
ncbi:hypothetical protein [Halobacillus litoralis]|uniref:Uncharacterized protein n=1 Tax=Halobacillus litoralis TaxID=45668 RepID=A0A410MGK7_9BACI|nr:hypothetical protein [Halobacillus litoralis]QAS53795.1 hypothetical protein HLI_17060 [Halobacillus litoralis]